MPRGVNASQNWHAPSRLRHHAGAKQPCRVHGPARHAAGQGRGGEVRPPPPAPLPADAPNRYDAGSGAATVAVSLSRAQMPGRASRASGSPGRRPVGRHTVRPCRPARPSPPPACRHPPGPRALSPPCPLPAIGVREHGRQRPPRSAAAAPPASELIRPASRRAPSLSCTRHAPPAALLGARLLLDAHNEDPCLGRLPRRTRARRAPPRPRPRRSLPWSPPNPCRPLSPPLPHASTTKILALAAPLAAEPVSR